MNKQLLKQINNLVKKRADEIQPRLPPLPGHPQRIAYAHLYKEIVLRFGRPVAELGDGRYDEVVKLIELCCDHADDPHISKYLTWVVPEPPKPTLDDWIE
jgi:hypothetical protein